MQRMPHGRRQHGKSPPIFENRYVSFRHLRDFAHALETIPGHEQSRVIAEQPSPPSPLSLSGRGGVEGILLRNFPSPREGEGQGVRAGG